MKNNIIPFNWQSELDKITVDRIGNDFILLDSPIIHSTFDHPFKVDVTTAIICLKGSLKGSVNLKPHNPVAPCFSIVLADQILEYDYVSEDFSGLFIVMSKKFTDNLDIEDRLPFFLSVQNEPNMPLNDESLEALVMYYRMMQRAIRQADNPYLLEMARHLTKVFFYGASYYFHKIPELDPKSKHEEHATAFLQLVQAHYRTERGLEFYAGKMFLTAKYLSKIVKEATGLTANEWIDNYVVLEAKALLKSTNMTVQQISDELNFPSQSFFGKYFKRVVGRSPKEYRGR